jgi:hypothetical protein
MIKHSTLLVYLAFATTHLSAVENQQASFLKKDFKFYGTHFATTVALTIVDYEIANSHPDIYKKTLYLYPLSVCCIAYKLPQWTDTYILQNNIQRTTKQNIIRLFTPGFLADYVMDLKLAHPVAAQPNQN